MPLVAAKMAALIKKDDKVRTRRPGAMLSIQKRVSHVV